MEVSCPNCSQRLRYSDQLLNPLLRCRNCLTTFRPNETKIAVEEPVTAVAIDEADPDYEPFRPVTAERSQQPESDSASSRWFGRSGAGSIGLVALVIAFKVGPRLLREVLRDRKPDRPVQMRNEDRQRAIEKEIQQAAEKAAAWRKIEALPMPDAPQRTVPIDPPVPIDR